MSKPSIDVQPSQLGLWLCMLLPLPSCRLLSLNWCYPFRWMIFVTFLQPLLLCLSLLFVCACPHIVFLLCTPLQGQHFSMTHTCLYVISCYTDYKLDHAWYSIWPWIISSPEASRSLTWTSALGFAFLETPQRQTSHRGHEDVDSPPFPGKPNPHTANQMNYSF